MVEAGDDAAGDLGVVVGPAQARAARRGPARRASAATSVSSISAALRLERDDAALAQPVAVLRGRSSPGSASRRRATTRATRRGARAAARPRPRRSRRGVAGSSGTRIVPTSCTSPASWSSRSSGCALGEQRGALQRVVEQVDVLLVGVLDAPRRAARSSSSGVTPCRRREVARLHDLAVLDLQHPGRALLDPVVVERDAALGEVVHEVADDVAVRCTARSGAVACSIELERVRSSPRPRRGSRRARPRARASAASGSTVCDAARVRARDSTRVTSRCASSSTRPSACGAAVARQRPQLVVPVEAAPAARLRVPHHEHIHSGGQVRRRSVGHEITVVVVGQLAYGFGRAGTSGSRRPRRSARTGPVVRAGRITPVAHHLRPALAGPGSARRASGSLELGADAGLLLAPPGARSPRRTRPARTCPSAGSSRRSGAGARAAPRRRRPAPCAQHDAAGGAHDRPRSVGVDERSRRRRRAASRPPATRRGSSRSIGADHPGEHRRPRTPRPAVVVLWATSRSHVGGDDRVLVVAEHVLQLRRRPWRSSRVSLAERGRDRLGGVPAALGPDPHLRAAASSGGSSASASTSRRRFRHGLRARAAGRTSVAGASASGSSAGSRAASTSRSSSCGVPVRAHRRRAARPARPPSGARAGRASCSPTAPVAVGERAHLGAAAARAAPRCRGPRRARAPSHFSSSRSASSHSGTSSERNVRRSERSRRVATRAWCTCSGSSPRRTPGSWASRRAHRRRDRRVHDVARRRSRRDEVVRRRRRRVARRARIPSARTIFGRRVGRPGAGRLQPRDERVGELDRRVLAELDLELAEAGGDPPAVEHRHLVVDDLGDLLAAAVDELDAPAPGLQARDRVRRSRCAPTRARGRPRRRAATSGLAGEGVLAAHEQRPVARCSGSFTVQPSGLR